jgi:pyruvate/2-oxoglutarate dehydrogenase complex dihydrolipoamide dehydrogenase (E3) component
MAASFAIHQHLLSHKPRLVVIIGGGYTGLEMAEALSVLGVATTVIEQAKTVLKTVDTSLGEHVGAVLKHNGVQVNTSVTVEAIKPEGTQLRVFGSPAFYTVADMVLISVGVPP